VIAPADPEALALLARYGATIARCVADAREHHDAPDAMAVVALLPGAALYDEGRATHAAYGADWFEDAGAAVFAVTREAALEAACGDDVGATRERFRAYFAATPRGRVVVVFAGATVTLGRVDASPAERTVS
jgi:hypothetical protein